MPKVENLPPSCAVVMKSGNLSFLEPSGSLHLCNGTALAFKSKNVLKMNAKCKSKEKLFTSELVVIVNIYRLLSPAPGGMFHKK